MRELRGRRVLITGSARGIGLALARAFAREGCLLQLTDVDSTALERAAESLSADGAQCGHWTLDVCDEESIRSVRRRILAESGPPDVLVNNAGVVHGGTLLEVPLDLHVRTIRVNLLGVVAMTHAFLPDLIARPEAHVVNLASAAGLVGLPRAATYAASKWGVIGFSESLRLELRREGRRNVAVTVICPSYVRTGLFEGARPARGTRWLTPERVAAGTLRAVRRNRARWVTPGLVKLLPVVKGCTPPSWFDRIGGWFGVDAGMSDWKGRNS